MEKWLLVIKTDSRERGAAIAESRGYSHVAAQYSDKLQAAIVTAIGPGPHQWYHEDCVNHHQTIGALMWFQTLAQKVY